MSEEIHRQVVAFISGEFARGEGRQCILLELVSAQPGMRGEDIKSWDRKETPEVFESQAKIEELTTEIIRLAEEHAESFGSGVHRFEVRTLQHLGKRQKTAFRIRTEGDGVESQGPGEDAPTATGLVGQLMRHNETNQRVLVQVFQSSLGTLSRTLADMAEENRSLRADRNRQLEDIEKAKSQELERELAAQQQIAADARKDEALRKLYELAPIVKARLLGAGRTENGETPESIIVRELAASLSPEQMAEIARALKPNQTLLLGELINRAGQGTPAPGSPGAPGTPTQ